MSDELPDAGHEAPPVPKKNKWTVAREHTIGDTIPEKPKYNPSLGSLTTSFLGSTSAHGIPHVVNSKQWYRKVMWVVVFACALAYFLYQTTTLFTTFYDYPTSIRNEVKTQLSYSFPAVTVCNMNMLKKHHVAMLDKYSALVNIDSNTQYKVESRVEQIHYQYRRKRSIEEGGGDPDVDSGRTKRSPQEDAPAAPQGIAVPAPEEELLAVDEQFILLTSPSEVESPVTMVTETPEKPRGHDKHGKDKNGSTGKTGKPGKTGETGKTGKRGRPKRRPRKAGDKDKPRDKREIYDYGMDGSGEGEEWWYDDWDDWYDEQFYEEGHWEQGWFDEFEYEDYGFGNVRDDYEFDQFMAVSTTDDYSDLVDVLKPTREELDNYGHQPEDFIVQCSFDKKNCTHLDFAKNYNSYFGNCFTFNHPDTENATSRKTSKYGSRYGLRITLNIEYEEYLGLFSHNAGARVSVHPFNVTAFPEDYGVSAGPGKETEIAINLESIKRQKYPYESNCTDGAEQPLNYPGLYTVLGCSQTCLQNSLLEQCECIDTILDMVEASRCSITNKTQERCRQRIYYLHDNAMLGCDCPTACKEMLYPTSTSSSEWPSDPYTWLLAEKLIDERESLVVNKDSSYEDPTGIASYIKTSIRSNMVRVHIYIQDPSLRTIEEFPSYPWDKLLADIGGLLGLFIGVSALTAMELLEFAADATILCCKKLANRNKVEPFKSEKDAENPKMADENLTDHEMYPMVDPHNNGPGMVEPVEPVEPAMPPTRPRVHRGRRV